MALIEWDQSLSVGVPSLDAQHQKLVQTINALHAAMRVGHARNVVDKVMGDLERYTIEHFAHEERLLRSAGYAQLADQESSHKAFVAKLKGFKQKLAAGDASVSLEIMNFMRDWLINHIAKSDKQYSAHLVAKGVK